MERRRLTAGLERTFAQLIFRKGLSPDVALGDMERRLGSVFAAAGQAPPYSTQAERFRADLLALTRPSSDAQRRLAAYVKPPDPYELALARRAEERR